MKFNQASEVRRNLTARELLALQWETVSNVARTYENCLNTSHIVSVAWEQSDRSPRWTPTIGHYKIDVENCIRKAFAGREDELELNASWQHFLKGERATIGPTIAKMLRILSAAFRRSGLEPWEYFRSLRCYNKKPEAAGVA